MKHGHIELLVQVHTIFRGIIKQGVSCKTSEVPGCKLFTDVWLTIHLKAISRWVLQKGLGFRLCSDARRNHLETQRNPEWSLVNVKPTHDNEDSQIEKGNNPWTRVVLSYLHSLHHWHRHFEISKFFQVIMVSIKLKSSFSKSLCWAL